jgi:tetratricopeptide (TPR) repeat protein
MKIRPDTPGRSGARTTSGRPFTLAVDGSVAELRSSARMHSRASPCASRAMTIDRAFTAARSRTILAVRPPQRATTKSALDRLVVMALQQIEQGNLAGAIAAWKLAQEQGAEASSVGAKPWIVLECVQGRGPRDRTRPAPRPPQPRDEAWAAAWAHDLASVRDQLRSWPAARAEASGLMGVVHVLERRPREALDALDRALAIGPDADLVLHRVRALIHLARFGEARSVLSGLGDGESLGRRVLWALLQAHKNADDIAGHRRDYERFRERETHLNELFSATLPALVGQSVLDAAGRKPAKLIALLDDVLDRMAGNLGLAPTLAERSADGTRRFVPLVVPLTTREASVEALHSLRQVGVERALAAFERLQAQYPRSVQVRCYRGELYLWLGRYADAWKEFNETEAIEPTRWADVGKIAVLTLTGRTEEATRLTAATERRFSPVVGGTLPVYRGILRRRVGDLDSAIADLREALAAKGSRVGARIELCLALRARGDGAEAATEAARVYSEAAPILVSAADDAHLDWRREAALLLSSSALESALVSMRGNRSSSVVTWFDAEGELRILEPPLGLRERAREARGSLR